MKRILALLSALLIAASFVSCNTANKSADTDKAQAEEVVTDFDADTYYTRLTECVRQIKEKTDFVPDIVLVLGSGLGDFADSVKVVAEIPYGEIKGFPVSTVSGHDGTLIFCELEGKKVAIMNGRVHYYEGYDMQDVVLPLRVLHLLGAQTVILTNAVGAINTDYHVGDFVLNIDHISSFVPSPLIGENIDELGDRFTDMSKVYDEELISATEKIAEKENIATHRGVMVQVTGPQYETPTEIRMYRSLGADTVGMSTVVEAIAAKHMGMRVCCISCITNMAAGLQETISHDEVKSSSDNSAGNFSKLITGLLKEMTV
ncbi:MAG: purine-nucleoside phosphorylase [Ruminococcus sp.]|nr:purine-nucleoside phosphorylase [Ruminococcus sp.]